MVLILSHRLTSFTNFGEFIFHYMRINSGVFGMVYIIVYSHYSNLLVILLVKLHHSLAVIVVEVLSSQAELNMVMWSTVSLVSSVRQDSVTWSMSLSNDPH